MNRNEYQEIVENAYCSKALSVEAFDADLELEILNLLAEGGIWSTGSGFDDDTETDERGTKEEEVLEKYEELVLHFRPLVQDVLIKAVDNNRHVNVLTSWREVENHARVIPCCQHSETGAQVYVRYHPTDYSNHQVQAQKFNDVINKISDIYNIRLQELNATTSRYVPQPDKDGVVDSEEKLRRFAIDW